MADLPSYDKLQNAFHRAFEPEIATMLDGLPCPAGGRILDAPCGDGFYAQRLAKRVLHGGQLTAIDVNPAYLHEAKNRLAPFGSSVHVEAGDIYRLQFENGSFDLAFCGQSLITLDRPIEALTQFRRVLKPGGVATVFESDIYHYVMLPWPAGLEVALQKAVLDASRERYGSGLKLAAARRVSNHLRSAGFDGVEKRSVVADRIAPLAVVDREFLRLHFDYLRDMAFDRLTVDEQNDFDRLTQPGSPDCFTDSPGAEFTCLNTVYLARKS